jgi:hypothetical protein
MTNSKKIILTVIWIGLIAACKQTPEVRFLEPQPSKKRDLKAFPKEYQGQYISKSDSSLLTIDSKIVFQEWFGLSRVSDVEMQEELDTIYKKDIVIQLSDNWKMTVDIDDAGDSATIETYRIDTLFKLSETNLLRAFKGYLFLNYKQPKSTWSVKTLSLEKGQLDFNDLISTSQIDTLREITKIITVIDTASNRIDHYDLNPKRKELKEILERKQDKTGFIKIK